MLISIELLFLVTYVLVDDWYQRQGQYLVNRTVGDFPTFTNISVNLSLSGR